MVFSNNRLIYLLLNRCRTLEKHLINMKAIPNELSLLMPPHKPQYISSTEQWLAKKIYQEYCKIYTALNQSKISHVEYLRRFWSTETSQDRLFGNRCHSSTPKQTYTNRPTRKIICSMTPTKKYKSNWNNRIKISWKIDNTFAEDEFLGVKYQSLDWQSYWIPTPTSISASKSTREFSFSNEDKILKSKQKR